jgi:hypothetical protein
MDHKIQRIGPCKNKGLKTKWKQACRKRSDCHFKNLLKALTEASTSNIIIKDSLVNQSMSDELIELRIGDIKGEWVG